MLSYHAYRPACVLRVHGPDAASFLQGQFSNDLSQLPQGGVCYGLWLNRKGKIVADSFVLRLEREAFLLVSYYCAESVVHDRLDAYLIMEEAELEGCSEFGRGLCVWSDPAGEFAEMVGEVPSRGAFLEKEGVIASWGRRSEAACLEMIALSESGVSRLSQLEARLGESGAAALSEGYLASLAIRSLTPRIGLAFGESDLPQELGLEGDAVSFRKGCYLGQEVMARLHAMGKVRKGLGLFSIEGVNTSDLPLDLIDETGKRQGSLRECAPTDAGAIGLGVVSLAFAGSSLRAGAGVAKPLQREASFDG